MANLWVYGWIGSTITAITFLGIAVMLSRSLTRGRQWRTNPLGVGTFFIFLTCGGGHMVHSIQLLYPYLGLATAYGAAIRVEYSDWHMWLVDGLTALAGLAYWQMRKMFPTLVKGTAVYEDLRERSKQAMQIHDSVVQRIAHAQLAYDLNDEGEAKAALHNAVVAQKQIQLRLEAQ